MKLNYFSSIIAIAISSLLAYALYYFSYSDEKILLSIGGFCFIALTLISLVGIKFNNTRTTINVRIVASVFLTVALCSQFIFSFINFSAPGYIIINGILMLTFVLIAYIIYNAK